MDQIVTFILLAVGLIFALGLAAFGVVSLREREARAARVAFIAALVSGGGLAALGFMPGPIPMVAFWILVALSLGAAFSFVLPIGQVTAGEETPQLRFDEREIMFARARLQPGSPEYQSYYRLHPEHEAGDHRTRMLPGLLSPQSKFANPFQFASVDGSFFLTESLCEAVDGPVSETRQNLPPEEMTAYIKDLSRFYGASDVGVTLLHPQHVYSHIGRGSGVYGEPLPIAHKMAIAFTVEMDFDLVGTAPYPPTSMETGKEYVEAARVAIQLAATIRALGYPSRAHIDGNYRVIAPLVARDAGLGEIGRMTILMTPRQGPRVRLGVVTTDLPMIPNQRSPDTAILDFCAICEKCAQTCPSKAIPLGPRQEIDGVLRWKLDPDACFRYWNTAGTDCARCMAVCPYAHPDNLSHNLIRWGITRSGAFRRAALWLDDLFYGRKPASRRTPDWLDLP